MPQTEQIQVNCKNFKWNPNWDAYSSTFSKNTPLWKTDQYYMVKYFMLTVTKSSETCYWKITGNKNFSFLPGEGEYERARLHEEAFAILE